MKVSTNTVAYYMNLNLRRIFHNIISNVNAIRGKISKLECLSLSSFYASLIFDCKTRILLYGGWGWGWGGGTEWSKS